jgi:hypothetical protein
MPILSDQCNTGPLEVSLITNATINIGMLRRINKIIATTRSKMRFIYFLTFVGKRESYGMGKGEDDFVIAGGG